MAPAKIPVRVVQERDQFQDSNRTPCRFKGGKSGQAVAHVSVVDKVVCYGMAVGMWGAHSSRNHFKILHAREGTKAGRQQQAGERNQKSVTGISPVCFVIAPLGFPRL